MRKSLWGVSGFFVGAIIATAGDNAAPKVETTETAPPPVQATQAAAPSPEVRTITETVTETKYVVSDECIAFADLVDATWQEIDRYEDGIAPQQGVLYDTLGAIIDSDTNGVNEAITAQSSIQNATAGPLMRIIDNQPDLQEARAGCLATLEEQ